MYGRLKAMANICESIVRVYGTVQLVLAFKTEHVSGDLSSVYFDDVLVDGESSCGAVLTDLDHQVMDPSVNAPYEASLMLYVDSRWNEPIDWFRAIVARHKDLTFDISWVQAADLFAGGLEGVDGLISKESHRSDRELLVDDLFCMGVGECEECSKYSVAVLFDEECPFCIENNQPEPDFGQCGKCGDWVHFPCYTCQARALEAKAPRQVADATEEEALMQYIDHVAENRGDR
jgi:hypothetical protein